MLTSYSSPLSVRARLLKLNFVHRLTITDMEVLAEVWPRAIPSTSTQRLTGSSCSTKEALARASR